MEKENKIEELKELLENMSDDDIIYVWNEYCDANSYYDYRIEYMETFDDIMSGKTPLEIVDSIDTEFRTNDDYFVWGIYGAKSFSYIDDEINYDDLANYILDNDDDLGNSDIRIFLDELNDEEEGEE